MTFDQKAVSVALSRKCGLCGAKSDEPCVNIARNPPEPLTDRPCHFYRIEP